MKYLKGILKYILIIFILMVIFCTSLVLVSLIPKSWIEENTRKSAETMYATGEDEVIDKGYKLERLFVFTDALMVNTAYSIDNSHPLESAMLARRDYLPGQTTTVHQDIGKSLVSPERYYEEGEIKDECYQTRELLDTVNGVGDEAFEYARYWHGYLVFLRPLLCFLDYNGLKILSAISFAALSIILSILLYKKINLLTVISFWVSIIAGSVGIATQCINSIVPFLIAIIAAILLLWKYEKIKDISIYFFIVGAITCFFDLLTTPLVTFAIPAIVYYLYRQKQEAMTVKDGLHSLIKIGLSWVAGFGILWMMKWILTDLFYHKNLCSTAFQQVAYRTNGVIGRFSFLKQYTMTLQENLKNLDMVSILIAIVACLVYVGISIKNWKEMKTRIEELIPYLLIGLLPFLWYAVLGNHSLFHGFFTYRNLMITLFCIQIIVIKIVEVKKKEEDIKNEKN